MHNRHSEYITLLSGHGQYVIRLSAQGQYVIMLRAQGQYVIMLSGRRSRPIHHHHAQSRSNDQILNRMYDCPDSMLLSAGCECAESKFVIELY